MSGRAAPPPHVRTAIVGGGPASLAPLVSASRDGRLDDLLAGGLAVIERGSVLGVGRLGSYAINSDSTAETFLTAVLGHADPRLGRLAAEPLCQAFAALGRTAVPLGDAGILMRDIGAVLGEAIVAAGGAVWTGHEAIDAQRTCDGVWRVRLRRLPEGEPFEVTADYLLLATGGEQTRARLYGELVAGQPLLPTYDSRLMLSDDVLQPAGLAAVGQRLRGRTAPRVAIVGGSTSALATAGVLLRAHGDLLAAPGSVTVYHRRPLRVFYPSAAAALEDGYDAFGPDDICALSGFVFRLAGFRLDSRDLLMRVLGVGGRGPEPRLVLHDLAAGDPGETHRRFAEADVIVAALGYRPRALPVFDADGQEILLRGRSGPWPMVDEACRICDVQGRPIDALFGIGLAAGFVPRGRQGGEPSFRGQANGLWLWQTAVGAMLVDHMLADDRSPRPAPAAEDGVACLAVPAAPIAA